jgi:competence protein ComEC
MQSCVLRFRIQRAFLLAALLLSCSGLEQRDTLQHAVTFSVLNVGQGLSQMCSIDDRAVLFDLGDSVTDLPWQIGYQRLGSPRIEAIVISHGDRDHRGGLRFLSDSARFSGLLITNPYEDTALLKAAPVSWTSRFFCRRVSRGDTLRLLDDVTIVCLWPPATVEQAAYEKNKNRYSLCFRIVHGNTSALISSDIDSLAMDTLADSSGYGLHSEIIVVPHHGSRGSLNARFYGYVHPEYAVISCGLHNPYNHPSDTVVKFLALQSMVELFDTRFDGTVAGRSTGEYWEFK